MRPILKILLVLAQLLCAVSASNKCFIRESESDYALLAMIYNTTSTTDLHQCWEKCKEDEECSSVNFNLLSQNCDRSYASKAAFPKFYVKQVLSVYMNIRNPGYGLSKKTALPSCKKILQENSQAPSGSYWISPASSQSAFQVFCDMVTDGGGWTLVYSYRFIDFLNFINYRNGLTPIPSWPITSSPSNNAPKSTTVPRNESDFAAMEFALWKTIGSEILLKSNITHWVSCTPGTGDLVNWKAGSVSCKVVKNVANVCLNYAPDHIVIHNNCGLSFYRNGDYSYLFEGNLLSCYPVHDACGARSVTNHLTTAIQPSGSIFIR